MVCSLAHRLLWEAPAVGATARAQAWMEPRSRRRLPEEVMGDEHGEVSRTPRCLCEEPSAAAGSNSCGGPPRADEGDADGSGADFHPCGESKEAG